MTSFLKRLPDRLARLTSSGDFIAEIDGLRFVAIAVVVLHHIASIYMENSGRFGTEIQFPRDWRKLSDQSTLVLALWQGYFGVQLFFVISGFVLGLPFARQFLAGGPAPSTKNYFLRRLTRIEPPYVINMLLVFLFLALYQPVSWDLWKHLGASLLYIHNLIYERGSAINGVAWSLEIEVQFYILAPLFARAAFAIRDAALRRVVLMAAIAACGCFTYFVLWKTRMEWAKMSLLAYMQYFLAGFLLADLHQTRAVRSGQGSLGWDVAGASAAVLTWLTMMHWRKWLYVGLPYMILVFYAGAFQGRLLRWFFTARPIVIIGGMCYTIYLYHVPVISICKSLMQAVSAPGLPLWQDLGIQAAVFVPLILSVSAAFFVVAEKPFMGRTFRRRLSRSAPDRLAPSPRPALPPHLSS